jgi:hypothetical protein
MHALLNEIKENNYYVNVLWEGNIACLWVLEIDFFNDLWATDFI